MGGQLRTPMRYSHSKDRSAELLRAAIGLMGRHDAAFNPLTFAVWYEYAAGMNGRLTRAIEECLRTEPRLGDATVECLYRDYVSDIDQAAVQRASGDLQRVLSSISDSALSTGGKAEAFGEELGGLTQALRSEQASTLQPILARTLTETADMRHSVAALHQQVISSQQEIERLQSDLVRARDESLIDPLTRILNRKGFDQKLQAMLELQPETGCAHCLVMLDIDRFKAVNDTYGHVMGDRVLQAVAELLSNTAPDLVQRLARFGGEEFAIVLPQSTLASAVALAESCRERVRAMKVRDRRSQHVVLTVTISAGVAAMQADDDAASLIARADDALYAAKQAGRDRVCER